MKLIRIPDGVTRVTYSLNGKVSWSLYETSLFSEEDIRIEFANKYPELKIIKIEEL